MDAQQPAQEKPSAAMACVNRQKTATTATWLTETAALQSAKWRPRAVMALWIPVNSATTETGPTVMGVARLAELRGAAMAGDARLKRATTAIYGQKTDAPRRAPWNSVLLAREALRPL